ncbi:MAG: restriction endonuclease subunit S [Treponemataceae bacterium]
MSYLNELIARLCPNGVEYEKLNNIVTFRRGSFPQPYGNSEWYGGENSMPFVQVADVSDENFLLNIETKQQISELAQPKSIFVPIGTVVVTLQGTIGRVAITQYDCYIDRTLAIFNNYKIEIDKKFFAYQLKAKFDVEKIKARGSTLKTITKEDFSQFTIPLPPLEIQQEIVRILDTFSDLTAELITELKAELTARKKQYEYYRETLLSFNEREVQYLPMGNENIGKFIRGSGLQKKDFTETGVGCIHYGQIYTYYGTYTDKTKTFVSVEFAKKARMAKHGDLVIATTSETDDDVCKAVAWLGDEEIAVSSDACFYTHSLNPKYVAYFFQTEQFQKQKRAFITGTKVRRVNADSLAKIKIPLPPLSEQQRIVDILDRFDTLCNDLSTGLPAEIEARQQQYEYYRDKLLTFQEKVNA